METIKKIMLPVAMCLAIGLGASSCTKTTDTKKLAEESDESKFGHSEKENDALFLINAAAINLEEIELGKIAEQNSERTDVQTLGKMMHDEHIKCLEGLVVLAKSKNITIPSSPTDEAKAAVKNTQDLMGNDFDKIYCDMMVKGHKKAIAMFEKETKVSKDKDITAWAEKTLPDLKRHLEHAEACQMKCK